MDFHKQLAIVLFVFCFFTGVSSAGVPPTPTVDSSSIDALAEQGKPDSCDADGNPIDRRTGNKFQYESDYLSPYKNGLSFSRSYNSRKFVPGELWKRIKGGKSYFVWAPLGFALPETESIAFDSSAVEKTATGVVGIWSHSYSQRLELIENNNYSQVIVHFADGRKKALPVIWDKSLSEYTSQSIDYSKLGWLRTSISRLSDGTWKLLNRVKRTTEYFDTIGRLARIEFADGSEHTLTYTANQVEVSDSFNNTMTIKFDASGQLNSLELPDGRFVKYEWTKNLLEKAFYSQTDVVTASTPFRKYSYLAYEPVENAITKGGIAPYYWAEYSMLTGITDEEGNDYASWEYDFTAGETYTKYKFARANVSSHFGGVGRVNVDMINAFSGEIEIDVTRGEGVIDKYKYNASQKTFAQLSNVDSDSNGTGCAFEDRQSYVTNHITKKEHAGNGRGRVYGHAVKHISKENGAKTTFRYQDDSKLFLESSPHISAFNMSKTAKRYKYDHQPLDANGGYGDNINCNEEECTYRYAEYNYSAHGNLTSLKEAGLSKVWAYEDEGKLLSSIKLIDTDENPSKPYPTNGNERVINFIYTSDTDNVIGKQLKQIDGPRTDLEDITTFEYYPEGHVYQGLTHKVVNALGHETIFTEYDNGRPTKVTTPNGLSIQLDYHYRGWLKSIKEGSDLTTIAYYDNGLVKKVTLPNSSFTEYSYNQAQLLTQVVNNLGEKITYSDFDSQGNALKIETKNASSVTKQISSFVTDKLGRLEKILGNYGQSTQSEYNLNGSVDKLKQLVETSIDPETDTETEVTNDSSTDYDVFGRARKIHYPDTGTVLLDYDKRNNLTKVTDQNNRVTEYIYDGLNNLVKLISPTTGETIYWYDAAGNMTKRQRDNGVVTEYVYDALNRLTNVNFPANSAANIQYIFDEIEDNENGIGFLTQVIDPSGTSHNWYNVKGQLIKEEKSIYNSVYVTRYAYNNMGMLTKLTYPSGRIVDYAFDSIGRLSKVTTQAYAGGAVHELAKDYDYLPFGPRTDVTLGSSLNHNRGFDLDYRLTSNQLLKGTSKIYDDSYGYELTNNIDSIDDLVNSAFDQTFDYDSVGRLDAATGKYGTRDYDYDKTGNRTKQVKDSQTIDYGYYLSQLNSINVDNVSIGNFVYDDVGNTTYNPLRNHTYTYNDWNQLTQVNQGSQIIANYAYNAAGQRISKSISGTTILYHYTAAGVLIAESDSNGIYSNEYVYANGELLSILNLHSVEWAGNDLASGASIDSVWEDSNDMLLPSSNGGNSFYSHAVNGDGAISTHVSEFNTSHLESSDVGLMIRENADSDAAFASIAVEMKSTFVPIAAEIFIPIFVDLPSIKMSYRSTTGGAVTEESIGFSGRYIKLERNGDYITLLTSANGSSWTQAKSVYIPLGSDVLMGVNTNNLPTTANVQLASLQLTGNAVTSEDHKVYFVINNHLSTPQMLVDDAGTAVWRGSYDPYGKVAIELNSLELNIRFPGQYFDAETGLHYNYFRDYDPEIGRYIQSDPIGLAGGINTYGYVEGNPVNKSDPLGLWSTAVHNRLINGAFSNFSLAQRRAMMRGSAYADGMFNGNQDAAQSYMHMMTAEGLSRSESLAKFREYMKEKMGKYKSYTCKAQQWDAQGDRARAAVARDNAAFNLGMAMHPIMDSTSPAHTNLRFWDALGDWQWADHGPWPWSDEHLDDLTPALESQTTNIMQNILNTYGSDECGCEG